MARMASKYAIYKGWLYCRGFSTPYKSVFSTISDLHSSRSTLREVWGAHRGSALSKQIFRAGYYLPTLRADVVGYVQRYDQWQRHMDLHQAPSEALNSLNTPWPFFQWGMDILGPFPIAPGQLKFLIVAVDYITKWIEAEPLAQISLAWIQWLMF